MVLRASSKSKAGRTPDRSPHDSMVPSGTRTVASITVASGPGTIRSRTRRSLAPAPDADVASLEGVEGDGGEPRPLADAAAVACCGHCRSDLVRGELVERMGG